MMSGGDANLFPGALDAEPMKGRAVKVRPRDGETARTAMAGGGMLDPLRRPATVDGWLLLPLVDDAHPPLDIGVEHDIVEVDLPERTVKPSSLREAPGLPPELAAEVTRSLDVVGDVAIIRLKEALRPRGNEIGEALLKAQPRLRAVAVDDGVVGELRVRALTLVAGEGPLKTVHREHGMALEVDLEHAYFSPRLATEHMRVADMARPGERVLDMFTGVGPFAILIARYAEPSKVHAVDLNERATQLAKANVVRNGVADLVSVHQGDARVLVPKLGTFDRIVMNHPHGALDFIDVAMDAAGEGTAIHLHVIGTTGEAQLAAKDAVRAAVAAGLDGVEHENRREVRTYAPGVSHWCLDLRVKG